MKSVRTSRPVSVNRTALYAQPGLRSSSVCSFRLVAVARTRPRLLSSSPSSVSGTSENSDARHDETTIVDVSKEVDPRLKPQQHGPGFCACCRPRRTEPIQVITYMEGVVLEVETPDGTVVYLERDGDDVDPGANVEAAGSGSGGRSVPAWGQSGPIIYVPDVIIPPPEPSPPTT